VIKISHVTHLYRNETNETIHPERAAEKILGVLLAGIAWELHEGYWLRGEPIDSLEDVTPAILSASTFLCFIRRDGEPDR
jgi:hypothetical protein